jgi:hypothetical protein
MLRVTLLLPLIGSILLLFCALRGAQAGFSRASSAPRSEEDQLFIQRSTALALIQQDRPHDALTILENQSARPLVLVKESPLSPDRSPSTQVIVLSKEFVRLASETRKAGNTQAAQAYLLQCHILSKRIRASQSQDPMAQKVASAIEQMANRAEPRFPKE